ncbi:MAG: carbamoyl phosphate synthase small subunit [Alistipes sp.]|jgi:carbamoylphosphate synthase small subunit|nr:carbamoyl phosphate synthase small subunit [Alistipes sp.]
MSPKKTAVLVLEDGTKFTGFSFGADVSVSGEVVFNTAMCGYPELLSDPLTRGQIVALTYPLTGNYGIPCVAELESDRAQIAGLVVTDCSDEHSHWNARRGLCDWLREWGVPAICGVDTRELAKHLREKGEMAGRIIIDGAAEKVAAEPLRGLGEGLGEGLGGSSGGGGIAICHIGEGLKRSVVASLVRRGARVTTDFAADCDGYLLTGTVDEASAELIEKVREAIASGKPILGVCGGDLPLALAAGGRIEKLAHPHRGTNQPVIENGTPRAQITTQNHAWAVVADSLPAGWEVSYENLNDGSVEGIRHRALPFGAVSFHPEASLRPVEAEPIYDEFIDSIKSRK